MTRRVAARRVVLGLALLVVLAAPLAANPYWAFIASFALIWGLIILSLSLLAGWSGEVSIAAAAYLGVGAYVAGKVSAVAPFPVAVAAGVAAGIPLSILIGLPALRLRGLNLTVATLAFMLGMQDAVFPLFIGRQSNVAISRSDFLGLNMDDDYLYYLLVLAITGLVVAASLQVGRSMLRRRFVALNEDPLAFASLGGGPLGHKLTAFVLSGMVASLGGALWGMLNRQLSGGILTVGQSILFLAMAIVAGRGSVVAAFVGGAVFVVLPELYRTIPTVTQYTFLLSGVGMVLLLLQYPGGLASAPQVLREMSGKLRPGRGATTTQAVPPPSPRAAPAAAGDLRAVLGAERSAGSGSAHDEVLRVDDVTVRFGGVTAVADATLLIGPGSIVGLIGPNGAGKTTLMNAVSGFVRPDAGRVLYLGDDLAGTGVVERARGGIARTFQTPKVFPSLTVEENVLLGMTLGRGRWISGLAGASLRFATARERERAAFLLRLVGLTGMAAQSAGQIPHGAARLLEFARALASQPSLLLLDEPVAGLDERESDQFGELVTLAQQELGVSVLVVEHDVRWVKRICHELYVLDFGRMIAEGATDEVMADRRVAEAYLGG